MYNQRFFFKKPNKMLDKLSINIDTFRIKKIGNEKFLLANTKYLHSTKPLLCFSKCGVHYYNDTTKFFREYFQSIFFLSKVYLAKIKFFEKM